MSLDVVLFSPLPATVMQSLEARCTEHIFNWYDAHGDPDAPWGKLAIGSQKPSVEQARTMVWVDDEPAPAGHPKVELVLERLSAARSALTFERGGKVELDPLFVSALDFLVTNIGPGLVMMGGTLELAEDFALWLRAHPAAPDFATPPAKAAPKTASSSVGRDLLALLALDDDDEEEEDELEEVEEAPGVTAARGFLRALRTTEQLVLAEDADERELGERLLAFFEKMDATRIGRAVGDWLLDQPEVDELFADDNAVEEALRQNFSR